MNLRLFKTVFFIYILLSSTKSLSQDNSNLTHYFMNPYSINPSFAGADGKAALFLTYRKQWVNIEGAPVISNFSFHTPTGKSLGFGINVTNAQRSVLNTTSGYVTSSYHLSFSKHVRFRFAVSAGAAYNGVDVDEIQNIADPALQDLLLDNNIYLVGNAGVSLQVNHMNVGISIPNLFSDEYTSGDEFSVGKVKPFENAILFLTNRFYFADDKHAVEPYLLYRYSNILPSQFEVSAAVHLNHLVWFGGSYKQDFGVSAFGGVKLQKLFGIGYAYSLKNTGINEINSPTHEIQLNLLLGVRGKDKEYYSFVDTSVPKSKRQLALEKRREELARKREEEAERKRLAAEARKAEEAKKEEEAALAKKEEEARQQQLAEEQAEAERKQQEQREKEEQERLAKEKQLAEQQKEENPDTPEPKKNLIEEQSTDQRVVVKRGAHLLELAPGEYVMVGAFSNYEHAEEYSDELFFKGYQTRFGYITDIGHWYVYIWHGEDAAKAIEERNKYRKIPIFGKAWVISVQ